MFHSLLCEMNNLMQMSISIPYAAPKHNSYLIPLEDGSIIPCSNHLSLTYLLYHTIFTILSKHITSLVDLYSVGTTRSKLQNV